MNRQTSHSMQIVKREEKESRLVQFVLGEIASGRASVEGAWDVVALSMKSPVIAALERVLGELGCGETLHIRVLLAARMTHETGNHFAGVADFAARGAQTSRLLDAHEQLVMGPVSAWVGDCMRRDPCERDAFETFGDDNAQLASWGRRSFEYMWAGGKPVANGARRGRIARAVVSTPE
jgi:hypothetical protein